LIITVRYNYVNEKVPKNQLRNEMKGQNGIGVGKREGAEGGGEGGGEKKR